MVPPHHFYFAQIGILLPLQTLHLEGDKHESFYETHVEEINFLEELLLMVLELANHGVVAFVEHAVACRRVLKKVAFLVVCCKRTAASRPFASRTRFDQQFNAKTSQKSEKDKETELSTRIGCAEKSGILN